MTIRELMQEQRKRVRSRRIGRNTDSLRPEKRNRRGMNARSLLNLRPPWKPGEQSPNPGGRPRMKPLTDEYILVSKMTVAELPIQRSDSVIRAAAKGQWAKLIAGRAMNAREMGDRIEGPVTQR